MLGMLNPFGGVRLGDMLRQQLGATPFGQALGLGQTARPGPFSGVESDDLRPDARAMSGAPSGLRGAPSGPRTPDVLARRRQAIQSIESGGRYDAVGPRHKKLGRALGAYQVMEANVRPWTKAALGKEVDPETFLRSPDIQDAVFDHVFGAYADRFGDEALAAEAWFAGPGGVGKNRKDVLGTSTSKYSAMYRNAVRKGGSSRDIDPSDMRAQAIAEHREGGPDAFPPMPAGGRLPDAMHPLVAENPGYLPDRMSAPTMRRADAAHLPEQGPVPEEKPQTAVAQAVEQWKVNKTTRRLRGMGRAETIGALTAIGQMEREEQEAALRGPVVQVQGVR
jgi:hypothetical protein